MLYVFVGADTARAKTEARKRAKKHEVILVGEGAEPFSRTVSLALSSGLFSTPTAVIIDRPFDSQEGKTLLEEHGTALHKSSSPIFIISPTLSVADKKLLPKGAKVEKFETGGAKEQTRPNVFALTDSFLSGDRKKTWIQYQRLVSEGISPEEIYGVLAWAVRSALIAGKTKSAASAGLKPFVYSKSKRATERIGVEETEVLSRKLVLLYHRARSGEGSLALGLEHLILEKN